MSSSGSREARQEPPRLTSPMLAYRCNLDGCCCARWAIHFTGADLSRMARFLPADEVPEAIGRGLVCVLDEGAGRLDHFELTKRGDGDLCRFLEEDGGCGLQRRFGVEALPQLCVDFPVTLGELEGRQELHFDTVCPGVLDALFADTAPVTVATLDGPDEMFQRRLDSPCHQLSLALAGGPVRPQDAALVRGRVLEALRDVQRPALEHLQAIAYAVAILNDSADFEGFEIVYDRPALPFVRFLDYAIQASTGHWLARTFEFQTRFVYPKALRQQLVGRREELAAALDAWREPLQRWVAPHLEPLGPHLVRFLAHRYFSAFQRFSGEIALALGRIPQLFATALRFAAAFGHLLQRPVDADLMKVALGASSFIHRNNILPMTSGVWFIPDQFATDTPPARQFIPV